jgi:hypothetical protein
MKSKNRDFQRKRTKRLGVQIHRESQSGKQPTGHGAVEIGILRSTISVKNAISDWFGFPAGRRLTTKRAISRYPFCQLSAV